MFEGIEQIGRDIQWQNLWFRTSVLAGDLVKNLFRQVELPEGHNPA